MAIRLANTMFNSLKGRPVQVSVMLYYVGDIAWKLCIIVVVSCRVAYLMVKSHHSLLPFSIQWWSSRYHLQNPMLFLLTYRDCLKLIRLPDLCLTQGGLSSGYKKFIADKGLPDETYAAESVALIRISGTSIHNNKVVQVDAVCSL